eukprot:gb/GECG01013621.1/.p1 GENE.gb/GECG01013621.1/~~gb/GECG01013621.1/.p1  ORF type:complete len:1140 (+),score=160.75 gb/GECG01013621.1/:1-3420(+)
MPFSASPSRRTPAVIERPDLKAARSLDPNTGRKRVSHPAERPADHGIAPYGFEGIRESLQSLGMNLEEEDIRRVRNVGGQQSLSSIVSFGQLVGNQDPPPPTGRAKVSQKLCQNQHTTNTEVGEALQAHPVSEAVDDLGRSKSKLKSARTMGNRTRQKTVTIADQVERRAQPSSSDPHGIKHAFVNYVVPGDDGYASREAVEKGLRRVVGDGTGQDEDIKQILNTADPDNSGFIDFASFRDSILDGQSEGWNNTSIPLARQGTKTKKQPDKNKRQHPKKSQVQDLQSQRKKERLRRHLRERLRSTYGSDPNASRKFFLRLPRTSGDSVSIETAAKGLKEVGLQFSENDVAFLFDSTGVPSDSARLTFDSFAKVVEGDDSVVKSDAPAHGSSQPIAKESAVERVRREINEKEVYPSHAFLRLDRNRDGLLTPTEIKNGLNGFGIRVNDNEAAEIVQSLNAHGGVVDYSSFVNAFYGNQPNTTIHNGVTNGSTPSNRQSSGDKDQHFEQRAQSLRRMTPAREHKGGAMNHVGEYLDERGIYTTGRDLDAEEVSAEDRFYDFFYKTQPELHQPEAARDIYGTPAPFLDQRRVKEGERFDANQRTLEEKYGNRVLRQVANQLASKGNAKSLFMKLNTNRDSKVDSKELKLGLAKLGAPLTDDEFSALMRRIDTDSNGCISYAEFARAMKGDDPEADPVAQPTNVEGHHPHRYNRQWDSTEDKSRDSRRVNLDSRGVLQSLIGEGSTPSLSLENARLANDVSHRIASRSQHSKDVFLRLSTGGDTNNSIPADPKELQRRLRQVGVAVSDRAAKAFLEPLVEAGYNQVDYNTFTKLARPRGYLDVDAMESKLEQTPGSDRAFTGTMTIGRGAVGGSAGVGVEIPVNEDTEAEGIGRYGRSPGKIGKYGAEGDDLPASQYAYVDYANTGIISSDEDAANSNANYPASSLRRAAYEEQGELPVAGKVVARPSRKGFIQPSAAKYRSDHVWDLIRSHSGAPAQHQHQQTARPPPYAGPQSQAQESSKAVQRQISFQDTGDATTSQPSDQGSEVSSLSNGMGSHPGEVKVVRYKVPPPSPSGRNPVTDLSAGHAERQYNQEARAAQPPRYKSGHWQKYHTSNVFYNTQYPTGSPHKRSEGKRVGRFNPT